MANTATQTAAQSEEQKHCPKALGQELIEYAQHFVDNLMQP